MAIDGLTLWGANSWVSDLFDGLALIVAVGAAVYFGRRREASEAAVSRSGTKDAGDRPESDPTSLITT